jgi:hypothetical protein
MADDNVIVYTRTLKPRCSLTTSTSTGNAGRYLIIGSWFEDIAGLRHDRASLPNKSLLRIWGWLHRPKRLLLLKLFIRNSHAGHRALLNILIRRSRRFSLLVGPRRARPIERD